MNTPQSVQKEELTRDVREILDDCFDAFMQEELREKATQLVIDRISASVREETRKEDIEYVKSKAVWLSRASKEEPQRYIIDDVILSALQKLSD